MSFFRLLLLLAVIFIIYKLVMKLTSKRNSDDRNLETTSMVRCSFCDVYIVKGDAYIKDNKYYCNPDHFEKSQKSQ